MSLIEEALRRMHDPVITTTEQKSPAPPPAKRPRTIPPEPVHSWPTTASAGQAVRTNRLLIGMAAAVLVLGTALLAIGVWWQRQQHRESRPSVPSLPAEAVTTNRSVRNASKKSIKSQPTPKASTEESLIISGVVEGLGEPYAVINGAIVAIGEAIGEFTLVKIADGSVTLRRTDGSERILRLSR